MFDSRSNAITHVMCNGRPISITNLSMFDSWPNAIAHVVCNGRPISITNLSMFVRRTIVIHQAVVNGGAKGVTYFVCNRWALRIMYLMLDRRTTSCFSFNPRLFRSGSCKKLCLAIRFKNVKQLLSTQGSFRPGLVGFCFLIRFIFRHDERVRGEKRFGKNDSYVLQCSEKSLIWIDKFNKKLNKK